MSPVPDGWPRHTRLAAAAATLITPRVAGAPPPRLRRNQLRLVDVLALEMPGQPRVPAYPLVAVQVGRRSGKTLSELSLAVGRCAAWPGYRATYVAQSGLKSRDRFYDLYKALHDAGDGVPGWRARESRGEERLEFSNGSLLRFGPPKGDTFRSDATDLAIIDEAQEHDAAAGAELLAAVMPTMDTRPLAQLVVSGTATIDRERMLWQVLERARGGAEGWGVVEYAAPPTSVLDDAETWRATHPGLDDGLTTERRLRLSLGELGPELFGAEYLGIWPEPSTGSLAGQTWSAAGREHQPRPATGFGLGFDVSPDGARAALAVAWRPSPGGPAHIELIEARGETGWLLDLAPAIAGTSAPIAYDASGRGALDVADRLAQVRPRLKLRGLDAAEYVIACSAFSRALVDGDLTHPRQPQLDQAAEVAVRRPVGDAGWAWGRRRSDGDITPLVAATVALRALTTTPAPTRPRIRTRR